MSRKTETINRECGVRLSYLIKRNGMTQKSLAEKLGYEPQHISNIVRGTRRLTPDIARRICDEVFPSVFPDWLLCRVDYMNQEEKEEYAKRKWKERQKKEELYNKAFWTFIDCIEDLCGYELHSQDAGDFIAVSDINGKEIGAIASDSFSKLRDEIENFASYALQQLIRRELAPLPQSREGGGDNG